MHYTQPLDDLKTALLKNKNEVAGLLTGEASFSSVTLFLLGAIQRVESNAAGFQAMVTSLNYPVACAIIRMQIDTAMRVHGLRLMADPHQGTMMLLSGERYDRIRPKRGDKLRDAVLLNALSLEYDWIKKVYERTSGMVHLSGMHIHHVFDHSTSIINDDGSLSIELAIGPDSRNVPTELFEEICEAFVHISLIASSVAIATLKKEQSTLNRDEAG